MRYGSAERNIEPTNSFTSSARCRSARATFSLPQRNRQSHRERQYHRETRTRRQAIAPDELSRPVPRAVGPRTDRLAIQVMGDVLCEGIDGNVAIRRIFPERLQHDGVEIAAQAAHELPAVCGIAHRAARDDHIGFGNGVFQRGAAVPFQSIGSGPGEQLIENDAERIDVRRGGQRSPGDLFGTGVVRRQRASAELGQWCGIDAACGHQFRDAEVEQVHDAICGDEDVGGFQVAVYDQVRVRILHRAENLQKQSQPLAHRQRCRAQ